MTSAPSRPDGLLCCEVGRDRFAFRSGDVRHVERAEYMRPDGDGHGRIGTLRLGGQQVPVLALGQVLGTTRDERRAPGSDGHIAVTGDRNALTGWLVDRIARVAQPAAGHIAPLSWIVGAQASAWFEGLVRLCDYRSALLLSPHHLATPATDGARDRTPAFEQQSPNEASRPEPVAVVFSTTVFPWAWTGRLALSGSRIAAIVQPTEPIIVPGCDDHISGLTWWRRSAVPVIDFRRPDARTAHSRCVIAQCGSGQHGTLVAFAIDSEVVMCRPSADHRRLPESACPPFASGVFDVDGEAVALLDLEALLMPTDAALPR